MGSFEKHYQKGNVVQSSLSIGNHLDWYDIKEQEPAVPAVLGLWSNWLEGIFMPFKYMGWRVKNSPTLH